MALGFIFECFHGFRAWVLQGFGASGFSAALLQSFRVSAFTGCPEPQTQDPKTPNPNPNQRKSFRSPWTSAQAWPNPARLRFRL